MRNPICQRPTIRAAATLNRSGDTDEFHFQLLTAGTYDRIAVPTQIDEGQMRCELRISFSQRSTSITGSFEREAGAHSMHHREIDGWLNGRICWWFVKIDCTQGMIFSKRVFRCFE